MKRQLLATLILILCATTVEGCLVVRAAGKAVDAVVTGTGKVVKAITP